MRLNREQLRSIIYEVLSEITDKQLDTGDEVATIIRNKLVKGKIIDKYSSKHIDPAAGKLLKRAGDLMWVVNIGGKTIPLPADELTLISKADPKSKSMRPGPTEARPDPMGEGMYGILSHQSMMNNGDEPEEDEGEELQEATTDEEHAQEYFGKTRYDAIARTLVNKWSDKDPQVNWLAVAKSYVNAEKETTGKQLDLDTLHTALMKMVEQDDDFDDIVGQHDQPKSYQKPY